MYLEHFGLTKNPFLLNTDASSLYYARTHSQALVHLLQGVHHGNGITLLLGAPGTGKTTLLHSLMDLLSYTCVTPSITLFPMAESASGMLQQVLSGFGVKTDDRPAASLFKDLQELVYDLVRSGKRPLVIVDEAQRLNSEALDCLRLISSLQYPGRPSLQLLLSAQPEMAQTIAATGATALRQRISIRYQLTGLVSDEIWKYLALRLARAGGDDRVLFSSDAVGALSEYSAGIPRVINLLADHCLMAAYGGDSDYVDGALVSTVAEHLELSSEQHRPQREMHYEFPSEFSAETWRSAIAQFRLENVPEPLRKMAEMLLPRPSFLPSAQGVELAW